MAIERRVLGSVHHRELGLLQLDPTPATVLSLQEITTGKVKPVVQNCVTFDNPGETTSFHRPDHSPDGSLYSPLTPYVRLLTRDVPVNGSTTDRTGRR